ncbi:MAG: SDR family oxidoreductase, partial [Alphaproteobacteria bacterium]
IGAASALLFARSGASVVVADLRVDQGEEVVKRIHSEGGKAIFIKCDIAQESEIKKLINMTIETFGKLDCAFNNAGIEGDVADTTAATNDNWERVININLRGIWLCMKYQIPEMLRNGGGSIVNCSSIAGLVGFAGIGAYTASKHGVIGLTQSAAIEFAQKNIRVNAICPGVIQTPMVQRFTKGDDVALKNLVEGAPIGRAGRPEEIAHAALWLCSDASSFVTGHPLVADGGWIAR